LTAVRRRAASSPSAIFAVAVGNRIFLSKLEDQEWLISLHAKPENEKFDYVEGFVIVDEALINNWRSSFFSPANPVKISSFNNKPDGDVLYCLEITKNYHESASPTVDQVNPYPNNYH